MEQQVDLNKLTIDQLKAIGYDLLVQQQTLIQNITIVQQILNVKIQENSKENK